jgi:hypothetical protein
MHTWITNGQFNVAEWREFFYGFHLPRTKQTKALKSAIKKNNIPPSKTLNSVFVLRVARFLFVQNTKMGKNIPNYHEIYQMSIKLTKDL